MFVQSLEAAQKQHTILTKHQESEARLLERQEERKKRMEEKAEREVAAEVLYPGRLFLLIPYRITI